MLKHYQIPLLSLLILPILSKGQTLTTQIGFSQTQLDFTYDYGSGSTGKAYQSPFVGYAIGGSLNFGKNPMLFYSTDLTIYRSGGKPDKTEPPNRTPIKMGNIALGGSLHFSPLKGKTKVELEAGPCVRYLFHGQKSDELSFLNDAKKLTRFNYGFNLGLGLYQEFKNIRIGVRGMFLQSIKKTIDLKYGTIGGFGIKAKEHSFLIQFCIGKPLNQS
jgi:hypothetical protein